VFCCANCFGDEYLSREINTPHAQIGTCDFCQSQNVALADPTDFMDEFEFLMSIYKETPSGTGKCIIDCIADDWEIFKGRERLSCVQLLGNIIGDATLGSKFFSPATMVQTSPKDMWINFCNELIHQHRFFPDNQPDSNYLPILFQNLKETVQGFIFRARIQNGTIQFKKCEMGMPSVQQVRGGRANPIGIPYFYAASNVNTAIAEIRPHPGNKVSVCKFKTIHELVLLNLINPRERISPFEIAYQQGDEDYLLQLRYDVEFLCHLGAELSKPITPEVADVEYLPTQYLCELVKKSQFDGVKFQSSVGDGVNYTLFSESKVKAVSVSSHYVKGLEYMTEKV
jgi:hypothetical protein